MKVDRKRDLRRHRAQVLDLVDAGFDMDYVTRETGLTVHQVRLILAAWGPR